MLHPTSFSDVVISITLNIVMQKVKFSLMIMAYTVQVLFFVF